MDIKRREALAIWILLGSCLLWSCSASPSLAPTLTVSPKTQIPSTPTATLAPMPTRLPGPWQVVGVYSADHSIMTAGFLNEQVAATGGMLGQMAYSNNAAATWLVTDAHSDCRYGIEVVNPQVIFTCGGATQVRKSVDGGKTWQVLAAFGNYRTITNPCHSMSFLDENIGWLANSDLFGTTVDGGVTWTMQALPETANKVATIDTYDSGEGYLLDQSGVLFFTSDDGVHWTETGHLDLGALNMSLSAYQLAAMRFADSQHGLVIVSPTDKGTAEPVIAFHTSNGGGTWTSEVVPVPAGPVYLARDGKLLTVISAVDQLTLLKYEE
jgi:photosystem II stability/assembly factor-like uncharacterized protein